MAISKREGLSPAQWVQWSVATAISAIVMIGAVLAWVDAHVYTRREGKQLENQVIEIKDDVASLESRYEQRFEAMQERFDRKLISMHNKINKIYEILIEKKGGR